MLGPPTYQATGRSSTACRLCPRYPSWVEVLDVRLREVDRGEVVRCDQAHDVVVDVLDGVADELLPLGSVGLRALRLDHLVQLRVVGVLDRVLRRGMERAKEVGVDVGEDSDGSAGGHLVVALEADIVELARLRRLERHVDADLRPLRLHQLHERDIAFTVALARIQKLDIETSRQSRLSQQLFGLLRVVLQDLVDLRSVYVSGNAPASAQAPLPSASVRMISSRSSARLTACRTFTSANGEGGCICMTK